MDVASRSLLVTRIVTVSPSRQRNVGAGSEPLMVVATPGLPVKFTGDSAITKSNSVPFSTGGTARRGALLGNALNAGVDSPARTPPAANPGRNADEKGPVWAR